MNEENQYLLFLVGTVVKTGQIIHGNAPFRISGPLSLEVLIQQKQRWIQGAQDHIGLEIIAAISNVMKMDVVSPPGVNVI